MLPIALLVSACRPDLLASPRAGQEPTRPRVEVATRHLDAGTRSKTATRSTYEGTFSLEAHLSKPHDVMVRSTRLRVWTSPDGRARLDWETWPVGHEERREVDTVWLEGTRVWQRDSVKAPVTETTGKRAAQVRLRVEAAAPWHLIDRVRAARDRCSAIESDALTWTESDEEAALERRLTWDGATGRLTGVTHTFAHPRLGDTREELAFAGWNVQDGIAVPSAFTLREFEGADPIRTSPTVFDVRLVSFEAGVDVGSELDAPKTSAAAVPPARPTVVDEITTSEWEPGVTSFASKVMDGSTVIVEFDDHLIAIGAPLSSELGQRIVEAVREQFPKKPIRYVLFGHHHPHYTGGLRAFLAAGAKVVAPEIGARFAAEIAERPFSIRPDAWAHAGRRAEIETFRDTRVFEDAHQKLVVVDIGARSAHTDEYLVFYLPRTRTLIQDDIGWSAAQDGKLYFGPRSKGLYEALSERRLDVATIWQGWPVASPRPSLPFAELERGVKAMR